MRMFNNKGMDGPWGYGRFGVCVDNHTVEYFSVNLPASVDSLKVVAHWYDKRHGSNGTVFDDIDLEVKVYEGPNSISFKSDSGENNKERVYFDLTNTGSAWADIRVKGYDVSSDNAGCGINSNRVYLSWYYEDHARNDSNGPGTEILTD